MTTPGMDDPEDLEEAAWLEPLGPGRVAALERAVHAADRIGNGALGYRLRLQLIHACEYSGAADRAIGPYGQALVYADDHAGENGDVGGESLLWMYKWISATLPMLASVSLQRTDAAIDDMERRFAAVGASRSPIQKIRWRRLAWSGRVDEAVVAAEEWWADDESRGRKAVLADCNACDISEYAFLLSTADQHEDAIRIAEPVLARELTCMEVPECSQGELLRSLLAIGRTEAARTAHLNGWRAVEGRHNFVATIGHHIDFCGRTQNIDRGLRIWTESLHLTETCRVDIDRYWFALGALVLFDRAGDEHRIIEGGRSDAPIGDSGKVDLAEAREWTESQLGAVVAALDDRNGNDWFARTAQSRRSDGPERAVSLAGGE